MNTFFSLVVPSYNRGHLIHLLLDSLLKQEYAHFEVIVVDDGGKDNTKEIVEAYKEPRFRYYYKENAERGAARNYGAKLAKGDYINFFDSDDFAYPHHLTVAKQIVERENNPEIFHTGYEVIHADGRKIEVVNNFQGDIENDYVKSKRVSINSLFVRKDIAMEFPFSERRALSASEDALFICQLVARYPVRIDNTITTVIIQHDLRSMTSANAAQVIERKKLLLEELEKDKVFFERYGHCLRHINIEMSYLIALAHMLRKEKKKGWRIYLSVLGMQPGMLFSRRTLAVVKWSFK